MTHTDTTDLGIEQVRQLARDLAPEIASLPRLSCVVEQFLLSAGRDTASAADIAAALALDPILETWVLRQANSGFCKLNRPVATVGEACVVLGLEPVTRLVYAACTRDLLRRRLHCYHHPGQGFWLHGLAVGLAARRLAALLGGASPLGIESAQVAGLLHDVGKLLLDPRLPRAGGSRPVSPAVERALSGFDHGVHSAAVAVAWSLPESVVLALAFHHTDHYQPPARLVAVADHLVGHWRLGLATYPELDRPPPLADLAALAAPLGADMPLLARWAQDLPPLLVGLTEMIKAVGHGRPPAIDPAAGQDSTLRALQSRAGPAQDNGRGHTRRSARRRSGPPPRRGGRRR